jgi:hypothetical protein
MTEQSHPSPLASPPARITAWPGSETRKRTELVGVRFTTDELTEARALAAAHHMTIPELLRVCLLAIQSQEAIASTPDLETR